MPRCIAVGCNFKTKKKKKREVSLHRFPHEKKRSAQWEKDVGRTQLPKDPHLCSQHFSPEDFESFVRTKLMKELTGAPKPASVRKMLRETSETGNAGGSFK
uniref:THAP-type domain-containing protein n=1 Tax=Kryptolebias marmoratus TaxID=37003 RepID=A0A3Q3GB23_KRYMA